MQSELHDRLEYLVNYSSQLIFVSGDTIAQQQRTLEAFVYQQKNDTELALITASEHMDIADYRRELCRQLLGQLVGSYIRPLNELLAGLNHHEGPILITITQAQFIPDKLLQELWELVLQSRFANNKQHLNVLLFGETKWAESAKQWLPAKNTETPLLISSQSVSADRYSSDIDRLLSERRAAFEKHLEKRKQAGAIPMNNRLKSPWLWLVGFMVFVSCFALIMGWQYGATLSTLFNPIESANSLSSESAITLPEKQQSKPAAVLEIVPPQEVAQLREQEQPMRTEPQLRANPIVKQASSNTEQRLLEKEASTPGLVSTFDEALKANDKKIEATVAPAAKQDSTSEPLVVNDTAVHSPTITTANALLLNQTSQPSYWLQLAGLKDKSMLDAFVNDYDLTDQVLVYKTQRYGGDWFVILWKTSYPSLIAAREAVQSLPEFPGKADTFVKAARQINQELSANTAL